MFNEAINSLAASNTTKTLQPKPVEKLGASIEVSLPKAPKDEALELLHEFQAHRSQSEQDVEAAANTVVQDITEKNQLIEYRDEEHAVEASFVEGYIPGATPKIDITFPEGLRVKNPG